MAVPPASRFTVVLILPLPEALAQDEPLEAVHVQENVLYLLEMVSVTVAPVTALGPLLVTVMV